MKRLIAFVLSILLVFNIVFANYTASWVKNDIETVYTNLNSKLTSSYNKYKPNLTTIKEKISTGDYKLLSLFTWLEYNNFKTDFNWKYQDFVKKLVGKKSELVSKVDEAKSNFDAGVISSWEYEDKLQSIESDLSGYNASFNEKIKDFENTLSGTISSYNSKLESKLNTYKAILNKYKDEKNALEKMEQNYNAMLAKKEKLEEIVWISNKVLKEKKEELKKQIDDYFVKFVDDKYKKYLNQDPNIAYFSTGVQIKKDLILGYVNSEMDKTMDNITKQFFPENLNFDELSGQVNEIKNNFSTGSVNQYSDFMNQINTTNVKIKQFDTELQKYLDKFDNSKNEDNVLKIIKNNLIDKLKQATKIVQDDINQTFKSWLDFLSIKEKAEQALMDTVNKTYGQKIKNADLNSLNELKNILESYRSVIVLPQNIAVVNSLEKVVEAKIDELKNKQYIEKINYYETKISSLPIWNDNTEIEKIGKELDNLQLPEKYNKEIKKMKAQLEIKRNLNKLFETGAIRYYYRMWDLSDKVDNILTKVYEKYKKEWREEIFMKKINRALEKLAILEETLRNDKRSYYLIIIHNGIIKFKMQFIK